MFFSMKEEMLSKMKHTWQILLQWFMSKEKTKGDEILDYAKQKIWCKYKNDAAGPDEFDCSGLTYWAHKQVGITIPRVAKD